LRDWIRLGFLKRTRGKIRKTDLLYAIDRLGNESSPFEAEHYLERIHWKTGHPPDPFAKLQRSYFVWPSDRPILTPKELAAKIGCDPSLVRKAFSQKVPKRQLRRRFQLSKRLWEKKFPLTLFHYSGFPELPPGRLLSIRTVVNYLHDCCIEPVNSSYVKQLIQQQQIGVKKVNGAKTQFIIASTVKSFLKKMCENT
jgi:hypothetical protein